MRKFTLLVGGKDVDTGLYEYFPYTENLIEDPKKTLSIIRELKMGKKPVEAEKYVFAQYCKGDSALNKKAIKAAYEAAKQFADFPFSKRRKIYDDIHRLLLKNKQEYIDLLIIEGHPKRLAEWEFSGMEKGAQKETIDFYKNEIRKELGKEESKGHCERLYWVRRPDGVVCASAPGNAPSSNSFLAALVFLTGNTLILKPPLRSPVSTIFLWEKVVNEALKKNGVPAGTLNIILGNSKKITDDWFASPMINDFLYFGDSSVGIELGAKAYVAGKKPVLELSGNDVLFAWKDADVDKVVDSLMDSFLGAGQICMVPKIAAIHADIYDGLKEKLVSRVAKLKAALPTDAHTVLTPVTRIKDHFDYLKDALENGGELLCGGKRVDYNDREDERGMFVRPTVIGVENYEKALDMKCFREEIFFPLLPVIKIEGKDEDVFSKMVAMTKLSNYGLRASVWCSSDRYVRRFIKHLSSSGLLRINSKHVDFSLLLSSHGGPRFSGGPFGEMNYVWQKTSHLQGISRMVSEEK